MSKLNRLPLLAVLFGLAAMLAAPANAGASPAFQVGWHAIPAYATQTFHVTLVGGEIARIAVQGDGSSDLDLFVYDGNGNLIVQDLGFTDSCSVSLIVYWTDTFTVVVKNRGGCSNLYRIATN